MSKALYMIIFYRLPKTITLAHNATYAMAKPCYRWAKAHPTTAMPFFGVPAITRHRYKTQNVAATGGLKPTLRRLPIGKNDYAHRQQHPKPLTNS